MIGKSAQKNKENESFAITYKQSMEERSMQTSGLGRFPAGMQYAAE
ncbi:MAG: hypothetical protein K2N34_05270 [Lachnospiraceae bacterium]|nr:hypothetical protein [Lachnospiraceae bacterium]